MQDKFKNKTDTQLNSSHEYTPHKRDYMEEKPKKVLSHSEKDAVELPDNVTDPIISNNIVNAEFDYTYDGEDDI